jgi:glycyl-tRNA synthetase
MQDALDRLARYWSEQGCISVQPMNTEVGAGTLNPATFLRVLGPEPWKVGYVEPSVRPDDSRYGENPNRVQTHTQYQVILKPEPGNPQEVYLGSLAALGIDLDAHDVRFVEDNWASPALGAWGLGWEVWLDGLEITQFTYFQQAGGINLDPPAVEITYGMERILMALQGVRHFKDIEYAPGVSYGEVFGQAEYEMSRYYLDDADIETNKTLLKLYAAEAQRMIDARLPVPAHSYVLKCSHAFNVLDSRGAVSTAERAAEFAQMRRLAGSTAQLWMARREELEHPLGVVQALPAATAASVTPATGTDPRTLVFEIGTEELPPSVARDARAFLADALAERLAATRLTHGTVTTYATPRRLVAVVEAVSAIESDHTRTVKGPKVSAAFKPDGSPTPAVAGFARSQGVAVEDLARAQIAGVEHVVVDKHEQGRPAADVLAELLGEIVRSLRSPKNMRWNDPSLSYSRPIRWLLALWGEQVVPVTVSTLAAGATTRVHRKAAAPTVTVPSAESYPEILAANGIVLDPAERRAQIVEGAQRLAAEAGGVVDFEGEAALIDQIVYLVEQPLPLLGRFEERYLQLPEAVLATVMRKHQRYLPVYGADGRLLSSFVAVANGTVDPHVVRAGNEAVLRARYEDAAFFFNADQQLTPAQLRERVARLTFTDKLGSVLDRAERIAGQAGEFADRLELGADDRGTLDRVRALTKFDLGSQMVTEMTSLAGTMAREYALRAGEPAAVAQALYETELPRSAGDRLPTSLVGAIFALADRLDLLVGLAATVGLPTGSSDPFALRRAALGVLAIYRSQPELGAVPLDEALAGAARRQPVEVGPSVPGSSVLDDVQEFVVRRLELLLIEEGRAVDDVRAVLLHATRPHLVDGLLHQLEALSAVADFRLLAEALQRSRRIVPAGTPSEYDASVLVEPAELRLHEAVRQVRAELGAGAGADLERLLKAAAPVIGPVTDFFVDVFVMVDDPALRAARLGLLATVRDLGDNVLDWDKLRLSAE